MFKHSKLILGTTLLLGSLALCATSTSALARCKSQAYDEADAIDFCKAKLNCAETEVINCVGGVRRWICMCTKPNATNIYQSSDKLTPKEKKMMIEKAKRLKIKKKMEHFHH